MSRKSQQGRLVLNHSTHATGLMPVLQRLADVPLIKTITPGRLSQVRGRPSPLRIRVTVPIKGGHKMQVRSSGTVQEVFIVTTLDAAVLQHEVDRILAQL